jgi:hypothetical protein
VMTILDDVDDVDDVDDLDACSFHTKDRKRDLRNSAPWR